MEVFRSYNPLSTIYVLYNMQRGIDVIPFCITLPRGLELFGKRVAVEDQVKKFIDAF